MKNYGLFIRILCGLICLAGLVSSCYDDSAIWSEIKEQEARIVKLELLTEQYNTSLSSLQAIVNALDANDYATGLTPIQRNGKDVGFVMTFAQKQPVTIYFGDVSVGDLGGSFPEIGVSKDQDGNYYWTLNGIWLTDEAGEKILASGKVGTPGMPGAAGKDGATPKLKIQDNKWYVSYDNGISWEPLGDVPVSGSSSSVSGNSIFSGVRNLENSVVLILNDGTEIVVPKKKTASFVQSELTTSSALFTGVAYPVSPDYEVGIYYSLDSNVQVQKSQKLSCIDFDQDGGFVFRLTGLKTNTTYYWRSYVSMYGDIEYGPVQSFTTEKMPPLVKNITYSVTSLEGATWGLMMDYTYDESLRITGCALSEFENEDVNVYEAYTINYAEPVTLECADGYTGRREMSVLAFDKENRVISISQTLQDGDKTEVAIEYNPDGTQKKKTEAISYGSTTTMEFEYTDYSLSKIKYSYSSADYADSDEMIFDPDAYILNKYSADKINVDISMIQLGVVPEDAFMVLTHMGLCGKGFTGRYLCEMLNLDLFSSNYKEFEKYYGTTLKADYRAHAEDVQLCRKEEACPLNYEFNSEGSPVRCTARIPFEEYKVEYDLVAGQVVDQWEEFNVTTSQVETVYEYELVPANLVKTLKSIRYETFVGEITYVPEVNLNEGGNESLKENDGSWIN